MATVSLEATSVAIGATVYTLPATQLALVEGYNTAFATVSGVAVTTNDVVRDDKTVPLWGFTVVDGAVQGSIDLRPIGGIDLSKYATGILPLANNSAAVQSTVNPGGGIALGSQLNTGTVPYNGMPVQFTATVTPNLDPASNSFVGYSAVGTPQVQAVSIIANQLSQTLYDSSWLANQLNGPGSYQWRWIEGATGVGASNSLPNGSHLKYDVQGYIDAGSRSLTPTTLLLAASAAITLEFDHTAFKTGASGINTVSFNGSSVSQGPNVQNTNTVSGSDTPTITHSTDPNFQPTIEAVSLGAFSSTPAVNAVPHVTYNTTQHSAGYVNGGGRSTATITGVPAARAFRQSISGEIVVPANSIAPVSFTEYFPETWTPDGSHVVTISVGIGSTQLFGINAVFDVFDAGNNLMDSVSITNVSQQYSRQFTSGVPGNWYVTLSAFPTIAPTSKVQITVNGTVQGWSVYELYSDHNGPASVFFQFPGNTLPPTSAQTQIGFTIANVALAGDAHGTSALGVYLADPTNSQVLAQWTNVQAGQQLYYSAPGATGGGYFLFYYTYIAADNQTGTGSYASNLDTAGIIWSQSDPVTSYTYTPVQGATTTYATDATANAPVNSAAAITLAITSVSASTNNGNASGLFAILTDPTGSIVAQEAITTAGSFTYFASNAVAGKYIWSLYGAIVTSANNEQISLPVTATGSLSWYDTISQPITTYYQTTGQLYKYSTPTSTLAPVSSATQVTFSFSSVIAPANGFGVSYAILYLLNPNGLSVPFEYSVDNGATWRTAPAGTLASLGTTNYAVPNGSGGMQCRYLNSGAPSGAYSWCVFGMAFTNDTGDSAYVVSWTATYAWYLVGVSGGNVYLLAADGATRRSAANDANVAFSLLNPATLAFGVVNSATVPLTFSIAASSQGV